MSSALFLVLVILTSTVTRVHSQLENMASPNRRENIFHHLSISSNKFSSAFYSNVAPKFNDNVVCSPLSAHVILSLVAYGAREKTWQELKSGLYLPDDNSIAQNEFKSLLHPLNNPTDIELNLANAIYVQENVSLVPDFVSASTEFFNSDTSRVDFKNSAVSVRDINSWVEKQTKNRIKDVISADDIDDLTRIVLVNAIYFKGSWIHKFDAGLTENRPFYLTKNEIKHVPTMFKKFKYSHGELAELNARIIELPYSNQDFSMLILLPNEIDGLRHVEVNFNRESIENVQWRTNEVELFLPRFKVQSTIHLKETLLEMGMPTMFSDLANFAAMTPDPLKVDNVIQKAFIEVNEEGSEAAAATVVGMRQKRMADPPEIFQVDRPFMFVIQHKPSNIPMFVGSIRTLEELIERDEL